MAVRRTLFCFYVLNATNCLRELRCIHTRGNRKWLLTLTFSASLIPNFVTYFYSYIIPTALVLFLFSTALWTDSLCRSMSKVLMMPASLLLFTHADRQGVDILVTVCVFFVCTVTDFSGEDKASGVKFCKVVHRLPGQEIFHFCKLYSSRSPKSDESASAPLF